MGTTERADRKEIRLKNYDYSLNGAYFITICTHNRACLFGDIVGNGLDRSAAPALVGNGLDRSAALDLSTVTLQPTPDGTIAETDLRNIPQHFPHITIDKYVIMPNHIHAIVFIHGQEKTERSRPFPTLSTVIGLYKSGVSRKCGRPIWQKSYYDHVIRSRQAYQAYWQYIHINPLQWSLDEYHV